MTLLEVRTKFIQNSGRYDLVVDTTDYIDNGADFHIHAGQKYLDRLIDIPDSLARIFYKPMAGEYSITIPSSCRALHEVWINDSEKKWQLDYLEPNEFKKRYPSPVSDLTAGSPEYYTVIDMRSLAPDFQDDLGEYLDKVAIEDSGYGTRGVVFGPPLDVEHVIDVIGLFHQVKLNDDSDSNYWTYKEENLLIMSALRSLEAFNRNTAGVNDWTRVILDEINKIDLDLAHEESYGVTQMEG